tara:strand:+ start:37 stop:480 length:444 start_codon:yes stop_codon:yes gene_type:complete
MVCLGNICRSPLAEGILSSKLPKDNFIVESAGTSSFHSGNPPDPRSIEIAEKYNLDISKQKSRVFNLYDFESFDLIFVMDKVNYCDIIKLTKNKSEQNKVRLIMDYPGSNMIEVPDPYYGGTKGFKNIFALLNNACNYHSKQLTNSL